MQCLYLSESVAGDVSQYKTGTETLHLNRHENPYGLDSASEPALNKIQIRTVAQQATRLPGNSTCQYQTFLGSLATIRSDAVSDSSCR